MITSASTSVPRFLKALRDQLKARDGLHKVEVATGPLGKMSAGESIQFVKVDGTQSQATNRARDDTYEVFGWIWVKRPGANERSIEDARERAYAIFRELELQLKADHQVDDTVLHAEIANADLDQGIHDEGRWAQINFVLAVRGRII